MKVAAYQAPLACCRRRQDIMGVLREQLDRCEALDVEILCCPEAVLGGLGDYVDCPAEIAIDVARGGLQQSPRRWRARMAGRCGALVTYGSSAIVDATGTVRAASRPLQSDLLIADIVVGSAPESA